MVFSTCILPFGLRVCMLMCVVTLWCLCQRSRRVGFRTCMGLRATLTRSTCNTLRSCSATRIHIRAHTRTRARTRAYAYTGLLMLALKPSTRLPFGRTRVICSRPCGVRVVVVLLVDAQLDCGFVYARMETAAHGTL